MKKIVKILIVFITCFCFHHNVLAGNLSLYASSTSVTIGGSIAITIKGSELAGRFSLTSSNGSVLSGGASSIWLDGDSKTYTFRANSVGKATITVTPLDVADYNGNVYSTSKSITITVKAKPVIILSGDSSLSSLGIDDFTLSPEFNKNTLEYTSEIAPEITKINITASASHGGASISGIGVVDVSDGDNRLEVVVTAENGTKTTYVINAHVKEYNPVEVTIDDKKYTVVRKKTQIVPPENYTETTVTINEEEVPAYYSDITKYTLVALKDDTGTQNFYIYDNGNYKLYKEISFNQTKLYLLPLPEIPERYQKSIIVYNDENIDSYKTNQNSSYALLYGMNVGTGAMNYYMYDARENTVQIYNTEEIDLLDEKIEIYKYIIIGLLSFSFLLLLILTIMAFKKGSPKNSEKKEKKQKKEKKKKDDSEMDL